MIYRRLDDHGDATLATAGRLQSPRMRPQLLICVEPGDWRVWQRLNASRRHRGCRSTCAAIATSRARATSFAARAGDSKSLHEFFYRNMRRQHGVLMEGKEPVGVAGSTPRTGGFIAMAGLAGAAVIPG